MKITLSPTNDFVTVDGIMHRMWDGTTESGIPVQAAITRVAPRPNEATPEQMEAFLQEALQAGMRMPTDPLLRQQKIKDV